MARRRRAPPLEPDGPVFAFPTRSRCPTCRSTRTRRAGAKFVGEGKVQYRTCGACGRRYCVFGSLI